MNSFVLAALLASPMALADDTAAIAAGLGLKCSAPADDEWETYTRNDNPDDPNPDYTVEGCYASGKASQQRNLEYI